MPQTIEEEEAELDSYRPQHLKEILKKSFLQQPTALSKMEILKREMRMFKKEQCK